MGYRSAIRAPTAWLRLRCLLTMHPISAGEGSRRELQLPRNERPLPLPNVTIFLRTAPPSTALSFCPSPQAPLCNLRAQSEKEICCRPAVIFNHSPKAMCTKHYSSGPFVIHFKTQNPPHSMQTGRTNWTNFFCLIWEPCLPASQKVYFSPVTV
jgi:hypothetical protein